MNIKDFSNIVYTFPQYIATIKLDNNRACGYKFEYLSGFEELIRHEGCCYFLVHNDEIVKIGMTSTSIARRLASYTAGTEENKMKGSCSTTNYQVSSYIRENEGNWEVYILPIPSYSFKFYFLGEQVIEEHSPARTCEKMLLQTFQKYNNQLPLLNKNG